MMMRCGSPMVTVRVLRPFRERRVASMAWGCTSFALPLGAAGLPTAHGRSGGCFLVLNSRRKFGSSGVHGAKASVGAGG